eukprot:3833644-Rhodomonas_salina.3
MSSTDRCDRTYMDFLASDSACVMERVGDVNVVRGRKCVHIGCKKQPAFGDPSTGQYESRMENGCLWGCSRSN